MNQLSAYLQGRDACSARSLGEMKLGGARA